MDRDPEHLTMREVERRDPSVPELLRHMPVVRRAGLEFQRVATDLVVVRRVAIDVPQWRQRADAELERLRAAARAGDRGARRALAEIGLEAPPPAHWSEASERDQDEEGA